MGARADAVEASRERIARAALARFIAEPYDAVTIASVAKDAGVSHQTVLNHFTSKEGLFTAATERFGADVMKLRGERTGHDAASAVALAVEQYEATGDGNVRLAMLDDRIPAVKAALDFGRATHQAWLAEVFADRLPSAAARARPRPFPASRSHRRLHLEAAAPRLRSRPAGHAENHDRHGHRDTRLERNESMSRHYLFAMWDGAGTVPPELSVARALIERGHRVTVLGDPTIEPEATAVGAGFRPWHEAPHLRSRRPEDDYIRDFEVDNPPELIARMCERIICGPAAAYAAETTAAIRELEPDAVVSSAFLLGPQIAAEAAGLPVVAQFANIYPLPAPGVPPFGCRLRPRAQRSRARDVCRDRAGERRDVERAPRAPQRGPCRARAGSAAKECGSSSTMPTACSC